MRAALARRTPPPPVQRRIVRAAAMAAAAALGVMLGFGLHGTGSDGWATALARLSVVVLRIRGLPEFVTPDRDGGAAALLGGLHVAVVAAAWGVVAGALGERLAVRGTPARFAALAFVGVFAGLAAADVLLPTALRLAAGTLTGAEWLVMIVVVASAAVIGAR